MKQRRMRDGVLEICDEDDVQILSIAENLDDDNRMIIKLTGEIRNEVAHEFEDEVMAALSVCKKLVLDFEGVTYIASSALRALLSVQQIVDEIDGSGMRLINVSPSVKEILKESGFLEILEVEDN